MFTNYHGFESSFKKQKARFSFDQIRFLCTYQQNAQYGRDFFNLIATSVFRMSFSQAHLTTFGSRFGTTQLTGRAKELGITPA
jgi:hypothetical protein